MAEAIELEIVSRADSAGLKQGAKDLKEMREEADKLGDSLEEVGESGAQVDKELDAQADQIHKLQAEYKATTAKIKELNAELLDAGNDKGARRDLGQQRSWLRELTRLAKELEKTSGLKFNVDLGEFVDAGSETGNTFGKAFAEAFQDVGKSPLLAGAIGGLITAALPPLGAMIGGALGGAVGTAAMAAGILSTIKNPAVKSAAGRFGDFIVGEFFQDNAFVRPVVAGLDILREGVDDLGITDFLAPLASSVVTIAHGIADFVNNLKDDGLSDTFGRMDEFAHIAAEGLAGLGSSLGGFFDMITRDAGAMDGLRAFFLTLSGTVTLLGISINVLEKIFHAFSVTAAAAFNLLDKLSPGDFFQPFARGAEAVIGVLPEVSGQLVRMSTATNAVNAGLDPFNAYLDEADEHAKDLTYSLGKLFGVQMNVDEATLHWKEGILALNEELGKGKFNLDSTTESGLRHQQMVLSQIESATRLADATFAQTQDQQAANATYAAATEELRKFLVKAGLSKAAIDAMIGNYAITVTTTFKTKGSKPSFLIGNLSGPAADILRARGGPVKAGQPYVVGDGGRPEWFVPESNGFVYPDVPGGGQGGGGGAGVMGRPLNLYGGGLGEAVFEWLREQIAAKGGTLAVLGLRAT